MIEILKQSLQPLLADIINDEFNQAMLNETLTNEQYTNYCVQDQLYLEQYARALAMIAARCDKPQHVRTFLGFAYEAVDQEQALHVQHLKQNKALAETWMQQGMNAVCRDYTDFLLTQTATQPLSVAISAVLPCFYIYQQVGRYMLQSPQYHDQHRYRDWIQVYASDGFTKATDQAFSILIDCLDSALIKSVQQTFMQAAAFEQAFWQACIKAASQYSVEFPHALNDVVLCLWYKTKW